ncbi:uncharacterized protein METZ01_LOCUS365217 [marine metagenome]|uniref:Uncharacterized protein n=1 Tax=marine metagenome TaxID=408172 RepID=A0A382SRE1_9ZZZZ
MPIAASFFTTLLEASRLARDLTLLLMHIAFLLLGQAKKTRQLLLDGTKGLFSCIF